MSATATTVQDNVQCEKPQVLSGVTPYLSVKGAIAASEFYVKAFGAKVVGCYPPDEKGRSCHVHLHLNKGSLMLSDFFPEYGHGETTPASFNLMVQVDDIDQWWSRAVAAGAEVVTPVSKMFWGDRYGQLRDPFGVMWAFNEPAAE
jgi:PhnB protein